MQVLIIIYCLHLKEMFVVYFDIISATTVADLHFSPEKHSSTTLAEFPSENVFCYFAILFFMLLLLSSRI